MKRTWRRPSSLPESLQRHLNAYAIAASATGVGVLALLPPTECLVPASVALAGLLAAPETAQAKIVYTPAHKMIPSCHLTSNSKLCLRLDLNHDRIVDFTIPAGFLHDGGYSLAVQPALKQKKNQIWGATSTKQIRCSSKTFTSEVHVASALSSGVTVGANSAKFQASHTAMWGASAGSCSSKGWGKWRSVKNKYLGLKFYVKGKVHYGWARLNTTSGGTLTGYAYETIPNKPIIAGKTKGPDVITVEPGSLGWLAQGSAGRSGK